MDGGSLVLLERAIGVGCIMVGLAPPMRVRLELALLPARCMPIPPSMGELALELPPDPDRST